MYFFFTLCSEYIIDDWCNLFVLFLSFGRLSLSLFSLLVHLMIVTGFISIGIWFALNCNVSIKLGAWIYISFFSPFCARCFRINIIEAVRLNADRFLCLHPKNLSRSTYYYCALCTNCSNVPANLIIARPKSFIAVLFMFASFGFCIECHIIYPIEHTCVCVRL